MRKALGIAKREISQIPSFASVDGNFWWSKMLSLNLSSNGKPTPETVGKTSLIVPAHSPVGMCLIKQFMERSS